MNIEPTKNLRTLLTLEELALFIGSVILFGLITEYNWWMFALLFFLPDVSFAAYFINTKVGSWVYNLLHHKGIMIGLILAGYFAEMEWLLTVGIVFLGHAAFDRVFGYGLKFPDDFKHTHLGRVGN
ncbi:DUF4260 domain-containing protein [Gracilimonas halophila]|uniref:DUF4260 domain-containing protein n=1 Tax=Gracilimonas halophila TaxID=1834464 RepID=A0ABW5JHH5_9BACT